MLDCCSQYLPGYLGSLQVLHLLLRENLEKKCNHETCGGPTHSLDLLSGDPEVVGENRGSVPLLQRRQWAPALSSIASALMYL